MRLSAIIIGLMLVCHSEAEERLLIGVASNFVDVLRPVAEAFAEQRSVEVQLSSGSSGALFARIQNGAPYDVFLSADKERAQRLVDAGLSVEPASRLYAVGRLMLWSADPALADLNCLDVFRTDTTSRIAIANPSIAPYGSAAREFLEATFPDRAFVPRLVTGENIAQAAQFAAKGGVRFGLLAWSQREKLPDTGCSHLIAADVHEPIEQHAVALIGYSEKLSLDFLDYLQGEAVPLIEAAGYSVNKRE